jgi:hypothetical protein
VMAHVRHVPDFDDSLLRHFALDVEVVLERERRNLIGLEEAYGEIGPRPRGAPNESLSGGRETPEIVGRSSAVRPASGTTRLAEVEKPVDATSPIVLLTVDRRRNRNPPGSRSHAGTGAGGRSRCATDVVQSVR